MITYVRAHSLRASHMESHRAKMTFHACWLPVLTAPLQVVRCDAAAMLLLSALLPNQNNAPSQLFRSFRPQQFLDLGYFPPCKQQRRTSPSFSKIPSAAWKRPVEGPTTLRRPRGVAVSSQWPWSPQPGPIQDGVAVVQMPLTHRCAQIHLHLSNVSHTQNHCNPVCLLQRGFLRQPCVFLHSESCARPPWHLFSGSPTGFVTDRWS
ncbi:PREDICTED: uncharacterized protein LOC105573537 [Cercocebus atys]|uniref:uncharacterized protein LOC105573537 n=1 Tax=Cercocebus atys TaxID=9531 RepID=UPI0005F39F6C|nr:PREDICTED: uncharacterized protein LOC105573537 [Cercocebus atys]